MKKYRFGETNFGWLKKSNVVYFVLAWNAFGYCLYQYYKNRGAISDTSEWSKLSQTQKYAMIMCNPDDDISVVRLQGTSVKGQSNITVGDYVIPSPPLPPQSSSE